MREFSPSWAESQWLSCAGGSVTEILRYWMAKRAPLALQSPWDLPLPRQGGLQGLHQSSWLVEPRAGPVPTGLSVNPPRFPAASQEPHSGSHLTLLAGIPTSSVPVFVSPLRMCFP